MNAGTAALGAFSGIQRGNVSKCEVLSLVLIPVRAHAAMADYTVLSRSAEQTFKPLMTIIDISKDNGHYQQA